MLFACAEALHAHGYSNEACRLAVELARDLLANPPDLKVEQPQTKVDTVPVPITLKHIDSSSDPLIHCLPYNLINHHPKITVITCLLDLGKEEQGVNHPPDTGSH